MLKIEHLSKSYGTHNVLDDISLTLNHGIYGLLGANGAGKSTLLNLLTDNLKPTSGQILYSETEIARLGTAYRRKIGYTPQLQGMYEDFTAREFLHYIGALKGMKRREIKTQTEEFLSVVGLEWSAHRRLGGFSGGMRQRVLVAAAMLDRPEILILDEPTAGLDPGERLRLRTYLSELSMLSVERTVIVATHVVEDVEAVAERIIMLGGGGVAAMGSPAELTAGLCGKVFELHGEIDSLREAKKRYPLGRITLRGGESILRFTADCAPEDGVVAADAPTLEDVYLYYAGRQL